MADWMVAPPPSRTDCVIAAAAGPATPATSAITQSDLMFVPPDAARAAKSAARLQYHRTPVGRRPRVSIRSSPRGCTPLQHLALASDAFISSEGARHEPD